MAFDIYDFVFYNLLKYDHASSVLTGELQNDIIFGLLIPTIFIAIVLYFGVHQIFGAGHKAIGALSAITGLGVIVTLGWVPIIAGIGGFAFVIIIVGFFLTAFYRRLVPSGLEVGAYKAGRHAARLVDAGVPMIPEKQKRAFGAKLKGYDSDFHYADQAMAKYTGKGGVSVNTGNPVDDERIKYERQTELQRHSTMKNDALEKSISIIELIPKGQRIDFIDKYTSKDKTESGEPSLNKELHDMFKKQNAEEEKNKGK